MSVDLAPPSYGLSRRDRIVIAAGVAAVCLLAWLFTAYQAWTMQHRGMDAAMTMADDPAMTWSAAQLAIVFVMWCVMMTAMMLPGISPMVTAFAAINRRRRERDAPYVATAVFVLGYLVAWSCFAALATAIQWELDAHGLVSSMMTARSPALTAGLFVLAGLYQLSRLKEVCLAHCRSPVGFILSEWRDGPVGAVVMGLRHGVFCIGCCAALMLLLFAVAIMDLRWVAALTVLVTAEKLLPKAHLWRRAIGLALIVVGLALGAPLIL
jgi:predicted metal-binding membrane protein